MSQINTAISDSSDVDFEKNPIIFENNLVAQFFIFRGEEYLGWDCYNKGKIVVGKGAGVDLSLNDPAIEDIQAIFYFNNDHILVSDRGKGGKVCINGKEIKAAIIKPLDAITIGKYTLKIKLSTIKNNQKPALASSIYKNIAEVGAKAETEVETDISALQSDLAKTVESAGKDISIIDDQPDADKFGLIFNGELCKGHQLEKVKENLVKLLKTDMSSVENLLTRGRVIIKKNVDFQTAQKYNAACEQAGIICTVKEEKNTNRISDDENSRNALALESNENQEIQPEIIEPESIQPEIIEADQALQKSNLVADLMSQEFFSETEESYLKEPETAETDIPPEIIEKNLPKAMDKEPSIIPDPAPVNSDAIEPVDIEIKENENTEQIKDVIVADYSPYVEEDDDFDEEDYEEESSLHFLKGVMAASCNLEAEQDTEKVLEVIKSRHDRVLDVCFLTGREKYFIGIANKRFCLAENKKPGKLYFYYNDNFECRVDFDNNSAPAGFSLFSEGNLLSKKKKTYRDLLPENGSITINDGYFDYLIRIVDKGQSPEVAEALQEKKPFYKNFLQSAGFHIIFFLVMVPFIAFQETPVPPEPISRFVKIDMSQLEKKKTPPPKPKPVKAKPKIIKPIEPPPTAKKIKPTKSKKARSRKTAARSPKAGGGSGKKGNVKNRNVNQAGILGMLGSNIGFKPDVALAAVTNLDAVTSTSAASANFKVGGIVGKLGSAKISIPKTGVIKTQGSTQILRSAGVKGKGSIAALARGTTGQGQVMSMVSAKLSKSVRIHGGMSREKVKKVIDQHLDEISFCYENALISNPAIMGKIVFEWKILLSGRVGEVRIKSSTINSNNIHGCIKQAIKTWTFPKPTGQEVIVSYPFVFDIVGF